MKIVGLVLLVIAGLYLLVVALLFFLQESFLFQPTKLEANHQFEFPGKFEEIDLEMSDGAMINALHFKTDLPRGIILYFHGNAGSLDNWGEVAQYHVSLGYDVLIMDYRGYGKSTGVRSFEKLLSDAEEFYQYAATHYKEEDITVYGRSLGTGFASYVASRNNPLRLILESPFTSIVDMGNYFYPLAPAKWLIRYNFRPIEYLNTVECPIYIFHGTDDYVVPYLIGKRLFDAHEVGKDIRMISIENGGHNDLIDYALFRKEVELVLN